MFRSLIRFALLIVTVTAIGLGAGYGWLLWHVEQPLAIKEPFTFQVAKGSNLTKLADMLAEQRVIDTPASLLIYAKLFDRQQIRRGEYQVTSQDTPKSLIEKLNRGDVLNYQISFPEGLTFAQWLTRLQQAPKLKQQFNGDLTALNLPDESVEGWLFPDTYTFTALESDLDILRTAHQQMKRVLEEEWQRRQTGLPYETPYEALIMASIVEKETGVPEERQQIAGVFVRRLQKRMRLQTDPTVIYGLGKRYKGNLTRKHLREDTPYNTYTRRGLPPTPIAMPGREAIFAALNPAQGTALYFVAKGDGTHYFSDTLEQHTKAVRQYQLNRAADYRSSPVQTKK